MLPRHDQRAATLPSVTSASPMPTGQLVSMTPIAVEISLLVNQSATIFARRRLSRIPPAPLTVRPTHAPRKLALHAVMSPPVVIRARPATATRRLPKRWPRTPLGSAMSAPGNR